MWLTMSRWILGSEAMRPLRRILRAGAAGSGLVSITAGAGDECRVQSAECGISVAAAGTRLRPRLSFDDSSFVRTTRLVAAAMEGWSACARTLRRDESASAGMVAQRRGGLVVVGSRLGVGL